MPTPSVRDSFEALNAAISRRMDDPEAVVGLAADHRATLITFAEANINAPSQNADKARVGRVQARYLAGMLAVLDAGHAGSPFRDPDLTKAYLDQQGFSQGLDQSALQQDIEP